MTKALSRFLSIFLALCLAAETVPAAAICHTPLRQPLAGAWVFAQQALENPLTQSPRLGGNATVQTFRSESTSSGHVLPIAPDSRPSPVAAPDNKAAGFAELFSGIDSSPASVFNRAAKRIFKNHRKWYWAYTVIGAAFWETRVFQQYGTGHGLSGLLWATVGFALAHTIVNWILNTKDSAEETLNPRTLFLHHLILSVGFLSPFLFALPHAFLWSVLFHAVYNALALWRGWEPASIINPSNPNAAQLNTEIIGSDTSRAELAQQFLKEKVDAWMQREGRKPSQQEVLSLLKQFLRARDNDVLKTPETVEVPPSAPAEPSQKGAMERVRLNLDLQQVNALIREHAQTDTEKDLTEELFGEYIPNSDQIVAHGEIIMEGPHVRVQIIPSAHSLPFLNQNAMPAGRAVVQFELYVRAGELRIEIVDAVSKGNKNPLRLYREFEAMAQSIADQTGRPVTAITETAFFKTRTTWNAEKMKYEWVDRKEDASTQFGWQQSQPAQSLLKLLWIQNIDPLLRQRGIYVENFRTSGIQQNNFRHYRKIFVPQSQEEVPRTNHTPTLVGRALSPDHLEAVQKARVYGTGKRQFFDTRHLLGPLALRVNAVPIYVTPEYLEFDHFLLARATRPMGKGSEGIFISPTHFKTLSELSPKAQEQFWNHMLAQYSRLDAPEEEIRAQYPLDRVEVELDALAADSYWTTLQTGHSSDYAHPYTHEQSQFADTVRQELLLQQLTHTIEEGSIREAPLAAKALGNLARQAAIADPSGAFLMQRVYPLFKTIFDMNYAQNESLQTEAVNQLGALAEAMIATNADSGRILKQSWEPLYQIAGQHFREPSVLALAEIDHALQRKPSDTEARNLWRLWLEEASASQNSESRKTALRVRVQSLLVQGNIQQAAALCREYLSQPLPPMAEAAAQSLSLLVGSATSLTSADPLFKEIIQLVQSGLKFNDFGVQRASSKSVADLIRLLHEADPSGQLLVNVALPMLTPYFRSNSSESGDLSVWAYAIYSLPDNDAKHVLESEFQKTWARMIRNPGSDAQAATKALRGLLLGSLAYDPTGKDFEDRLWPIVKSEIYDRDQLRFGVVHEMGVALTELSPYPEIRNRLLDEFRPAIQAAADSDNDHMNAGAAAFLTALADRSLDSDPTLADLQTSWVPQFKAAMTRSSEAPRLALQSLEHITNRLRASGRVTHEQAAQLASLIEAALQPKTHVYAATTAGEILGSFGRFLRQLDPSGHLFDELWMPLYSMAIENKSQGATGSVLSSLYDGALVLRQLAPGSRALAAQINASPTLIADQPLTQSNLAVSLVDAPENWGMIAELLGNLTNLNLSTISRGHLQILSRSLIYHLSHLRHAFDPAIAQVAYRHYFPGEALPQNGADPVALFAHILFDFELRRHGLDPELAAQFRRARTPLEADDLIAMVQLLSQNDEGYLEALRLFDSYGRWIDEHRSASVRTVFNRTIRRLLVLAARHSAVYRSLFVWEQVARLIQDAGARNPAASQRRHSTAALARQSEELVQLLPILESARVLSGTPAYHFFTELQKISFHQIHRTGNFSTRDRKYHAYLDTLHEWLNDVELRHRLSMLPARRFELILQWYHGLSDTTGGDHSGLDQILFLINLETSDAQFEKVISMARHEQSGTVFVSYLFNSEMEAALSKIQAALGQTFVNAVLQRSIDVVMAYQQPEPEMFFAMMTYPQTTDDLNQKFDLVFGSMNRDQAMAAVSADIFSLFRLSDHDLSSGLKLLKEVLGQDMVESHLLQGHFALLYDWIVLLNVATNDGDTNLLRSFKEQMAACPTDKREDYLNALVRLKPALARVSISLKPDELRPWLGNLRVFVSIGPVLEKFVQFAGKRKPAKELADRFIRQFLASGKRYFANDLKLFLDSVIQSLKDEVALVGTGDSETNPLKFLSKGLQKNLARRAQRFFMGFLQSDITPAAMSRRYHLMRIVADLLNIQHSLRNVKGMEKYRVALGNGALALLGIRNVDVEAIKRALDFRRSVLKNVLRFITGVDHWPEALDRDPALLDRVLYMVSLYYALRKHDLNKDETRSRIQDNLAIFMKTGSMAAVRRNILEEPANAAEVERLVELGYDRALFTRGIATREIEVQPIHQGDRQKTAKQTLKLLSDELIEIAQAVGYQPEGLSREQLAGLRFETHAEAAAFVEDMRRAFPGNPRLARTQQILDTLKQVEDELTTTGVVTALPEKVRIVISKDFLEEASAGLGGWAGCFELNHLHQEMPVVHGTEVSAFIARAYNSGGQMIANTVLALTDQGVVVFAAYNGRPDLNLDPAWLEAWAQLSNVSPAVILNTGSAGIVGATAAQASGAAIETKAVSKAVKRATVWSKTYFDSGYGETDNHGNTTFDIPRALNITAHSFPTTEVLYANPAKEDVSSPSSAVEAPLPQILRKIEKSLIQQTLFTNPLISTIHMANFLPFIDDIVLRDSNEQMEARLLTLKTRGKEGGAPSAEALGALRQTLQEVRSLYRDSARLEDYRIRHGVQAFASQLPAWRKQIKHTPNEEELLAQLRDVLVDSVGLDLNAAHPVRSRGAPATAKNARLSKNDTVLLDFEAERIRQALAQSVPEAPDASLGELLLGQYSPLESQVLLQGQWRIHDGEPTLTLTPAPADAEASDTLSFALYRRHNRLFIRVQDLASQDDAVLVALYQRFEALSQFLSNELNTAITAEGETDFADIRRLERLGWSSEKPLQSRIKALWDQQVAPALIANGIPSLPSLHSSLELRDARYVQRSFAPTQEFAAPQDVAVDLLALVAQLRAKPGDALYAMATFWRPWYKLLDRVGLGRVVTTLAAIVESIFLKSGWWSIEQFIDKHRGGVLTIHGWIEEGHILYKPMLEELEFFAASIQGLPLWRHILAHIRFNHIHRNTPRRAA